MSRPTCVEARLVFSDGTVQRAMGEAAEVVDGVLQQQAIDRSASSGWTTTRPHRKVTVMRASHLHQGYDHEGLWNEDETIALGFDGDILPPETRGEADGVDGPLCDFRIEVEAVPAKEEGR